MNVDFSGILQLPSDFLIYFGRSRHERGTPISLPRILGLTWISLAFFNFHQIFLYVSLTIYMSEAVQCRLLGFWDKRGFLWHFSTSIRFFDIFRSFTT